MPERDQSLEPPSNGTTEAEAFLQQRLALLHKVLFFFLGAILLANFVAIGFLFSWDSATWEQLQPHRIVHLGLTLAFGMSWRVLSRGRLHGPLLVTVDALGLVGLMATLGFMTSYVSTGRVGALDISVSLSLILSIRAVVIPSSGRQTLVLGLVASAVCIAVFIWRAVHHPFELPFIIRNLSRDHAVTMSLWAGLAIAGSTIASRVIYGLRKEIRVARRIGQYELLEKIGEGGMGEVYRARHALLRRQTAIKLLPRVNLGPERLRRFEREVRMTARLTHPNTVAVFDYGRTPEGLFYYAMEYLDGLDLDRLVAFAGALPVARVAHILRQILLSLTEAHEMGLVHRDIKPANVILSERGGEADVAKVVDFGLVKDLQVGDSPELTAAGAITGTPLYMAPRRSGLPRRPAPRAICTRQRPSRTTSSPAPTCFRPRPSWRSVPITCTRSPSRRRNGTAEPCPTRSRD